LPLSRSSRTRRCSGRSSRRRTPPRRAPVRWPKRSASAPATRRTRATTAKAAAVIAARRLDSYTPQQAKVTSWLGGFVWGPHLTPRQTWNLIDTTLRWQQGRWLVLRSDTETTPAPVPSIVYVDGENNHAAAFARLAGMTAPFYGTGG
jgi:hypothetical protein